MYTVYKRGQKYMFVRQHVNKQLNGPQPQNRHKNYAVRTYEHDPGLEAGHCRRVHALGLEYGQDGPRVVTQQISVHQKRPRDVNKHFWCFQKQRRRQVFSRTSDR
ncbi:JM67 [macacine gammaherpesvirus 11]|uniref:JM67 n=2 Tax=macacine gammaherpesvirus 11 TaxID=2560570 RepID=G9JM75_9GAMA|nr:JM67 [Macaca fuscata rhadinovirus]AAT00044.1 JM67 [Macaca fuscata rhadinovirus]AEW87592.1 JM67 [Macaca fuscata rhadinovirus]AEW87762.1 JM67 [Macaca fuscata rhadinovirus]